MNEKDMLQDLLEFRTTSQRFYNTCAIIIMNPEARQLFIGIRDDEMRAVTQLQQSLERMLAKPSIISKIFPTKHKY